ncbi:hypothetical protein JCM10449v2_000871 [Rhodotorula kratochvilovae]
MQPSPHPHTTPATAPPPRTTSLSPLADPAPPPPRPPSPSLPTDADLPPPSYDHARGNPRFPRWGPWIEKRANERRQERDHLRNTGALARTGWDLGEEGGEGAHGDEEGDRAQRERDDRAEKRLSRDSLSLVVANPDPTPSSSFSSCIDDRRPRSASGASTGGGDAVTQLTRHVQVLRVGGRFAPGVPDELLCAVPLPSGGGSARNGEDERLILLGTANGLYLLDTHPLSASSPLSTSAPAADARILPLWTGLGVHHLAIHIEPADGAATSAPRGLVLGLVDVQGTGELEVRMWSLAGLVNLAKWRASDEHSVPLSLRPSLTPSSSSPSSSSPVDRRASLAFVKLVLSPASASPTKAGEKGKQPAAARAEALVRQASTEKGYLFVEPGPASSSSATEGMSRLSLDADSPSARLELPLEWATASVPLPVPKSGGAVLFLRLFPMPEAPRPGNADGEAEASSDEEDDDDFPSRRRERAAETRRLFLFVATARSIFLFESRPAERRSWVLTKEFFGSQAPATPRFLRLVRTAPPPPASATQDREAPYPPDLHLLLGTSYRLVLISLRTSAVTEPDVPSPARGTRARSSSSTSSASLPPPAAAGGHRKSPSTAAASVLKNLHTLATATGDKVSAFVQGDRAVPAGMRGLAPGELVRGRRVSDGAEGAERLAGAQERGKWSACEVLPLGGGAGEGYVLTRGGTSFLVPFLPSPSPSAASATGSFLPLPVGEAVHHPLAPVVRVHAAPLRVHEGNAGRRPVALCAFARTGLSVREVRSAPAPSADAEGEDAATLDYGRATRFLCSLAAGGGGALFAVEGRGEWVLKRVRVA